LAADPNTALDEALDGFEVSNGFIPAIVTQLSPKSVQVHTKNGEKLEITGKGLALVSRTLNEKKPEKDCSR